MTKEFQPQELIGLRRRRILLEDGKNMDVYFPSILKFSGKPFTLELETDRLKKLFRFSPHYPVRNLSFFDDGTNTYETDHYTLKSGGEYIINLGAIWKVASDYLDESLESKEKRLTAWVDGMEDRYGGYETMEVMGGSNETIRLAQLLATDRLISQAALTHLSSNQAGFKRYIEAHSLLLTEAETLTVAATGLFSLPAAGVILLTVPTARGYISHLLAKKVEDFKREFWEETVQSGPLIKIAPY